MGTDGSRLHGEGDGTEHVRRNPWLRTEIRVVALHNEVDFREVKAPEFFHDLPSGSRKGTGGIRIVFTQLFQDMVLVDGMTANVNETDINPPAELGRLADASGDKRSTRI